MIQKRLSDCDILRTKVKIINIFGKSITWQDNHLETYIYIS